MKSQIVGRVSLNDNREIRVTRIPTGLHEDLIRIGINLVPGGETMSGATFPALAVDDLIDVLKKVG